MTIKITGPGTFGNRDTLKATGAKWNGIDRYWYLPDGTPEHVLKSLRQMPGVVVSVPSPEPPSSVQKEREELQREIDRILDVVARDHERDLPKLSGEPNFHGDDETYLGKMTNNATAFFGFSSLAAMVDFVEATPRDIQLERWDNRNCGWHDGDIEFRGTASMESAILLARNGWRKGVAMARDASQIIQGDHAQTRQRKHAVAGGRVNVGRLLAGSPLHMVQRPRQNGTKVITLLVDIWMSYKIKAEVAIIRAACVAAICDVLENAGYSCEIVAVGSAYEETLRCQVATVIKQAGAILDLSDVVFALGHPSMLRRLCFALAANDRDLRRFWDGMGDQEMAFDDCDPGVFYINKMRKNVDGSFVDQVRNIFKHIVPDGLPVELSE